MTDASTSPVAKEHCNTCLGVKNHDVVHVEETFWQNELDEQQGVFIQGGDRWTLLKCRGCEDVRLKHASWFSEDTDADGRPISHSRWYPPTVERPKPPWMRSLLPFDARLEALSALLREIHDAAAIGANRLAVMGIRALAERAMVDTVGEQATFKATIDAFFKAGHVAPVQQPIFEEILVEAGHAAMHRDFAPAAKDVNTLLDIVEGVLTRLYWEPLVADAVRKSIPPRRPRRDA